MTLILFLCFVFQNPKIDLCQRFALVITTKREDMYLHRKFLPMSLLLVYRHGGHGGQTSKLNVCGDCPGFVRRMEAERKKATMAGFSSGL